MAKYPNLIRNAKVAKSKPLPPIVPPSTYEHAMGWDILQASYQEALRGKRRYTLEAVTYDLLSEINNVRLWRELRAIGTKPDPKKREYSPGPYRHRIITEPKTRSLHIPLLRDKIVQLTIHEELQNIFRPVFVSRSFACLFGKGPIRAALNVQHDMRIARMQWGEETTVIKIDIRKFFYSIDRELLKSFIRKRYKKLRKKYPELYNDFLRFYRLLCKVIDSSPEGPTGIPLGNVSSQDFANVYLNEVDQYCLRFLGIKFYTRYMDDIVILAPDRDTARSWLTKIRIFLHDKLHLDLNSKTKIFSLSQGVNAYGFKIKATHLLLRTASKRREKRRIKRMVQKLRDGQIAEENVFQAVSSWLGHARWACAYNLARKLLWPHPILRPLLEGPIPFGAVCRNRRARKVLQKRLAPPGLVPPPRAA